MSIALTLATLLATAGDPCGPSFARGGRDLSSAPSASGIPGLLDVPTATPVGTGQLLLGYHTDIRATAADSTAYQRNWTLGAGMFDRVAVSLRATDAVRTPRARFGALERDLSLNAAALLWSERGWVPAVAAVRLDAGGANSLYEATALVASKTVGSRARLTLGYGDAAQVLDGTFGGIEIAPCHWLRLIAEHDGIGRNVGVRLTPFPTLLEQWGAQLSVTFTDRHRQGASHAVGVRLPLGAPLPRAVTTTPDTTAPLPVRPYSFDLVPIELALADAGFENIRVRWSNSNHLVVNLEQRRFYREELDGVGVALGIIAARAPVSASVLTLTVRRVDIPVLTLVTGVDALRRYLTDASAEEQFALQLTVRHPTPDDVLGGNTYRSSRFKLDIVPSFRWENQAFTEKGVVDSRTSIAPQAVMQLGEGIAVTGRRAFVLQQSPWFFEGISDVNQDQLLVHVTRPLPERLTPSGALALGQLSVGRFGRHQVGAVLDSDVQLRGGQWAVSSQLGVFGASLGDDDRSIATLGLRWLDARGSLAVRVMGGHFASGDDGGSAEVRRRFGRTEIGFRLRHSGEGGSNGAIVVGIPLAPRRELRPTTVRLRAPDVWEHAQGTTIFETTNAVRGPITAPLPTGHEVARVYGARDWLRPGAVHERVSVLRDAALRWGLGS